MVNPPWIHFEADKNALYTYLIEDVSITDGGRFVHYMRVNVQGNDMSTGQDAFCYIPPFTFFPDPENPDALLFDPENVHEYVHLVYRQSGEVDPEAMGFGECGCDMMLAKRFNTLPHESLNEEPYNMVGPVAGTYTKVPSSDPETLELLCEMLNVPSADGQGVCGAGLEMLLPANLEGVSTGDLLCDPMMPKYLANEVGVLMG